MRKVLILGLFLLLAVSLAPAGSLYDQAVATRLERNFPQRELSYLLVDARTGRVVAERWAGPRSLPVGSLVKPFTAVAYGQLHGFHYPEHTCRGEVDGCWYAPGHGRIGLRRAVAHSCNLYFQRLAAKVTPETMQLAAHPFGLTALPAETQPATWAGLGEDWKQQPLALLRAYIELAERRTEPGVREVLHGLALSAREGTAQGVGRALPGATVLAKTGTAACAHGVEWSGDGYALALYPATAPRWALLVQVHGSPGASAAVAGGRLLRAVVEGK
jgi:cell division protein FtsI/penicillin-binding protein 2